MHRLTACNTLHPWGSTNVEAMSSTQDTNNSQHWRERAAQMRLLAIKMAGSQAAILINDLAADYEKLAERAEIKANGKKAAIERQAALGGVDFAACRSIVWACGPFRGSSPVQKLEPVLSITIRTPKRE